MTKVAVMLATGYEEGESGTWVDEVVVHDGNVLTSQGPGTTLHFAFALVDALGGNGDALRDGMLYGKALRDGALLHENVD